MRHLSLLLLTIAALSPAVAHAQSAPVRAEAERIASDIKGGARLQRTLGAIALYHFVGRQSGLRVFSRHSNTWWQDAFAPAAPKLVTMLHDESGLEWVDQNGMPEKTTAPYREATQALVALGRGAIPALIDGLSDPRTTVRAAEVLRTLVPDGPTGGNPAAWRAFWADRQGRPLPSEAGHWWQILLGTLVVGGGAAAVIALQLRARRTERRPVALKSS